MTMFACLRCNICSLFCHSAINKSIK